MQKIKVLILRPDQNEPGGVAIYYHLVKKYFRSRNVELEFYYIGKTHNTKSIRNRVLKTINDLLSLCKIFSNYDLVLLNPSFDPKSMIRDGIFNFAAKRLYHKKTLVFFHGWTLEFERLIDNFGKKIFKYFFKFDNACVLSNRAKQKLIQWGVDPKTIILETTVFEARFFDVVKTPFKIIFLSRFVEKKGCLEAIKAVQMLTESFPNIHLFMVGEGELYAQLKDYVLEHKLEKNIEFTGYLSGNKKYLILNQCGIMLYPTTYGEGMPISLLEGMGMGLALVTRPVGGIPGIVTDGHNGFLLRSTDPNDFASIVKYLLENLDVWRSISSINGQEAKQKYEIRNVVKRLEKIYLECAKPFLKYQAHEH